MTALHGQQGRTDLRALLLGGLQVRAVGGKLLALVLQLGPQLGQVALDLVDVPLRIDTGRAGLSRLSTCAPEAAWFQVPGLFLHCVEELQDT